MKPYIASHLTLAGSFPGDIDFTVHRGWFDSYVRNVLTAISAMDVDLPSL